MPQYLEVKKQPLQFGLKCFRRFIFRKRRCEGGKGRRKGKGKGKRKERERERMETLLGLPLGSGALRCDALSGQTLRQLPRGKKGALAPTRGGVILLEGIGLSGNRVAEGTESPPPAAPSPFGRTTAYQLDGPGGLPGGARPGREIRLAAWKGTTGREEGPPGWGRSPGSEVGWRGRGARARCLLLRGAHPLRTQTGRLRPGQGAVCPRSRSPRSGAQGSGVSCGGPGNGAGTALRGTCAPAQGCPRAGRALPLLT